MSLAGNDTGKLEGSVAVVTGASRGIGRAIAVAYGKQGAAVVCASRGLDELEETADAVRQAGGEALAVRCDITQDGDVAELAETARDRFGFADILVNNAGVHLAGPFLEHEMSDWEHIVDVNIYGTVRTTRAFLPAMLEEGRGRIINIASTAGKYGSLFQSPYNTTKHAVVGLTKCLALETAKTEVRVNAICPGFVATEMVDQVVDQFAGYLGVPTEEVIPTLLKRVPIGRLLEPEEIAELAVYLASPAAGAMTGQALTIAGGLILV